MGQVRILVFIAFLVAFPVIIIGQKNTVSLDAGYGYYQGFHLCVDYFYKENSSIGLGLGSHFGLDPFKNETHYNISLENSLHFGQRYKYVLKPWIFGQQIMYWIEGLESETWRIVTFSLTFGRAFAISNKLGLALEIGPTFNLVIDVDPYYTSGWMWPILYNYRMQITYNF